MRPLRPILRPTPLIRRISRLPPLHRNITPQKRFNYSSSAATAKDLQPAFKASPPPPPPKQRRSLFVYIWGTAFIFLGLAAGHVARSFVAPPPFPEPDSREDRFRLEVLRSDIDRLDIVKALRAEGYHLHSDTALDESGKGKSVWRELDFPVLLSETPAAKLENGSPTGVAEGDVPRTLTQKSMAGSGGLGIQRAFWNPVSRELIAVVFFGGRLSGWPGLAHGGAIATVFEDGLSRVVAGPDTALGSIPSPSSITLTYARPTQANNFYVLRASMSSRSDEKTIPIQSDYLDGKSWLPRVMNSTKQGPVPLGLEPVLEVDGTIENLSGQVCVRASATFPASAVRR